jgi:hypothetical protein
MKKIAALGAITAAFAFTATSAMADIACNAEGDCWHVREHVEYKPDLKIVVHPDAWKWGEHEHYRFKEHDGRGYWRGGTWVDIK